MLMKKGGREKEEERASTVRNVRFSSDKNKIDLASGKQ